MQTVFNFILAALVSLPLAEHAIGQQLVHGELLFVAPDLYAPGAEYSAEAVNSARAEEYCELARTACQQGDVGKALQWATRAVREDPNHATARRVLGYRRLGQQWAGSYAARRVERGEVWHQQYGWIQPDNLSRWEQGERLHGKRWITEQEDRRLHEDIEKGWRVRTDHFLITTNHSRQAAAQLATRLEALYQIWQQMFGGFYLDEEQLLRRFDGQEISGYRSRPFRVSYYKSRQDYNQQLLRQQPKIGMTLGIYFDRDRSTHFFAGEDQDAGTIYHEAVHQFFQESVSAARDVGGLSNAWLVEGIACYFESLAVHQDPNLGTIYTLGTPGSGRLPAARQRRLVDDYYVPLKKLSTLGTTDLQRRPDVARLYSQSAGLTTFLVHGREGAYRPALLKLLQLIYRGSRQGRFLEQTHGASVCGTRSRIPRISPVFAPLAENPTTLTTVCQGSTILGCVWWL